ncbi:MAG: hypothetical protein Q4G40_05465 [Brachybacterium sp.]|nr:hypothetical protein [Brachybacterium sp.]
MTRTTTRPHALRIAAAAAALTLGLSACTGTNGDDAADSDATPAEQTTTETTEDAEQAEDTDDADGSDAETDDGENSESDHDDADVPDDEPMTIRYTGILGEESIATESPWTVQSDVLAAELEGTMMFGAESVACEGDLEFTSGQSVACTTDGTDEDGGGGETAWFAHPVYHGDEAQPGVLFVEKAPLAEDTHDALFGESSRLTLVEVGLMYGEDGVDATSLAEQVENTLNSDTGMEPPGPGYEDVTCESGADFTWEEIIACEATDPDGEDVDLHVMPMRGNNAYGGVLVAIDDYYDW